MVVRRRVTTLERVRGIEGRIDEENGILYGCTILGPVSPNTHDVRGATHGTKYLLTAQRGALPRINGSHVKLNHVKGADGRDVEGQWAVIENATVEPDPESGGLLGITKGNLRYLTSKPISKEIVESAKKGLGLFSLSINAVSQGVVQDGWFVVDNIPVIRSVDLVDRGGTTRSLMERLEPPARKVRAMKKHITAVVREKLLPWMPKTAKLGRQFLTRIAKTFEDDASAVMPMDAPPDAENPDADPEEEDDPEELFKAAIKAAVAEIVDEGGTAEEMLGKIKAWFDAADVIKNGGEGGSDMGGDAGGSSDTKESKQLTELTKLVRGLQARLDADGKKTKVAATLERFQIEKKDLSAVEAETMEALAAAETDVALVDYVKKIKLSKSSGPRSMTDTYEQAGPDDPRRKALATGNAKDALAALNGLAIK